MLKLKSHSAFTLVELIVVITIVWILSTVGFVSYSWYLTWARDSNRISQLTKISDSLQTYAASKSLPVPDDSVNITLSWSSNVFAYQWYVWVDVLETIDYTNWWKDPKDDNYFTYYLTRDRKNMQLLAFMEESNIAKINTWNKVFANDYVDRFPRVYGQKLWVFTQSVTNAPLQEISSVKATWYFDMINTPDQYTAHISNSKKIQWNGVILGSTNPNSSCQRIKEAGLSRWKWNWDYTIFVPNLWETQVYCDMENAGWWWTLVARSKKWFTSDLFWWASPTRWNIYDDNTPYAIGLSFIQRVKFSEVMLATYSSKKDIDLAIKFDVNSSRIAWWTAAAHATQNCRDVVWDTSSGSTNGCNSAQYYWALWGTWSHRYYFNSSATLWEITPWAGTMYWFSQNGFINSDMGAMSGKEWMVFVK